MEKVCEVGSKNLLNNYPRLTTFLGANCFSLFLVMSTTKPDNFMELFWTFVGVLVWPRCSFYVCQEFEWIL